MKIFSRIAVPAVVALVVAAGAQSTNATCAIGHAGGWQTQGGEISIAAPSALTLPCGPDTSVWVSTGLVFDSGFETTYVSEPVRVACDPTLSDRPGDFRIIKKPRGQQRQQQN